VATISGLRKTVRGLAASLPKAIEGTRADRLSGRRISALVKSLVEFARQTEHRFAFSPPLGWVRFGSLDRTRPISDEFGVDRGQPVDRLYTEMFLAACTQDTKSRVVEFGDRNYTRKFGGNKVTQSDIWDIDRGNEAATIIGDRPLQARFRQILLIV
jgi:hypothetical protein